MTREEKIEAIYKEMANKEVSFGCKYKFIKKYQYCDWAWFEPGDLITLCKRDAKYEDSFLTTFFRDIALIKKDVYDYVEIIGHPVMIGDVLGWLDRKIFLLLDQGKEVEKLLKGSDALNLRLINVWKHKIKPLDEQPDYCIDYVTNILDKFGSVI